MPKAQHPRRRPPGRQRLELDEAKLSSLLDRGVTWQDAAKILGCSVTTIARRLRNPSPPPLAAHSPPPLADLDPVAPTGAEPTDRRARALATFDRAMQSDSSVAVQAARAALEEHRREVTAHEYGTIAERCARAFVREQARRLGVELRRRIDAGDEALGALYRVAANTRATPEDVEALAAWIDEHPDALAVLEAPAIEVRHG